MSKKMFSDDNAITANWRNVKVKYIFNVKNGGTPKSDVAEYWDEEGIVWVTPEDLSNEGIELYESKRKISDLGIKNSSANLIKPNSIVISTRAPIGNIKLVKVPFTTNQGCKSLENNSEIDMEYYYFYFSILKDYLNSFGYGTTFLELSNFALKNVKIVLPPLIEQKKISKYLKKIIGDINCIIQNKKNLITVLEEKRQSIITEVVTKGLNPNVKMKDSGIEWIGKIPEHWKIIAFKRCMKILNGREIEVELDKEDINGINVYGSGGAFKKTDRYLYSGESVLFGRKGTIGKPLYVNEPFWTVDTMYYTHFYENSYAKWFYYVLKIYPWKLIMTQTALPSIVGTDLANDLWAIPPYEEQIKIANFLTNEETKINEIIRTIRLQIQQLYEYRQSLIYEAVTGKIDVRDMERELDQDEVR
ncbi:restriction endonuclease subunit S [Caldifermentibacillus hisashii]|uniref:restriction endonuclease subunit S n=1 Tax=Caldifermentibacillus hisashii TaxID=996558 RepID=UPI002E241124|nr:restriction endonuclease subunit S [Caldifermentibacillus hisashii]MED3645026.1 restriction endonuclease subunit S [Caldifermentibacillus hisashii]